VLKAKKMPHQDEFLSSYVIVDAIPVTFLILILVVAKEIFYGHILLGLPRRKRHIEVTNHILREWTMFIVNILAFVFTFYSLVRTAKHHGKVLF
jgi:hypothetical protein